MKNELLTIKQFSELAGVSVQAVYKRLKKENSDLQVYLVANDGVKYLKRAALHDVYGIESAGSEASEPQDQRTEATRLLDILENELSELRQQLAAKDRQIEAQSAEIKTLLQQLDNSQKIIDQQQQLSAIHTQALLAANEQSESAGQKSWFARIFHRK